ncbi:hypothetical protein OG216_09895 [Streptomycetaceae bacterium NBC_01309]
MHDAAPAVALVLALVCLSLTAVLYLEARIHDDLYSDLRQAREHATGAEAEARRLRTILHLHGINPDTGRNHEEWTP